MFVIARYVIVKADFLESLVTVKRIRVNVLHQEVIKSVQGMVNVFVDNANVLEMKTDTLDSIVKIVVRVLLKGRNVLYTLWCDDLS